MRSFLVIILFILCMPLAGQTPTFEELEFEPDSVTKAYKPAGKNYVLIRSKRGNSGVNKTPAADAILTAEVTEIVLVFSEMDRSAIEDRQAANQERWENLLKTYPELFQFSTTYKNLCQCNNHGDSASFKQAQGFYVYVNGEVPKVEEPKVAATPPPATKPAKSEEPPVPAKPVKAEETPVKPLKVKEEVAVVDKTEVKTKEPPVIEKPAKEPVKETSKVAETPVEKEEAAEPVAKEPVKKKAAPAIASKPRRAKDAKACRPPCYGSGDEDLDNYFKENIPLTKKQRRKAKGWVAQARLQINFDGSIKKVLVTGVNEEFNLQLQEVLKNMNSWNAAVKNGVSVKSEVRFTVKYYSETKSMKPFDMVMNPRPTPKCKCVSDSEIFESAD